MRAYPVCPRMRGIRPLPRRALVQGGRRWTVVAGTSAWPRGFPRECGGSSPPAGRSAHIFGCPCSQWRPQARRPASGRVLRPTLSTRPPECRDPRRRRLRLQKHARELMVNLVVAGLSFLAGDGRPFCPQRGRRGAALSDAQKATVAGVEDAVMQWSPADLRSERLACGRKGKELAGLISRVWSASDGLGAPSYGAEGRGVRGSCRCGPTGFGCQAPRPM